MKKGDIVVYIGIPSILCEKRQHLIKEKYTNLTIGKQYEILDVFFAHIIIMDDKGFINDYIGGFKLLSDFIKDIREEKLNELLK
jgi:hypothetical protein